VQTTIVRDAVGSGFSCRGWSARMCCPDANLIQMTLVAASGYARHRQWIMAGPDSRFRFDVNSRAAYMNVSLDAQESDAEARSARAM